MKVYVVTSALDYEGYGLPELVTEDREAAIEFIRKAPPPGPTEAYGVYEYTVGMEGQGYLIASRRKYRPVWKP